MTPDSTPAVLRSAERPPYDAHDMRELPDVGARPAEVRTGGCDGTSGGAPSATRASGDGRLPEDADLDLITDFIAESRHALAGAEAMLLELESNPHDQESINTVFRAFHTVKGTSSFLGLSLITEFAHHAETLLSRMRDRELVCAGGYADLALRSVDTLKLLLDGVEDARGGGAIEVPSGYRSLMEALIDPETAGISAAVSDETTAIPRLGDILVGFGRADRAAIEAALRSPSGQPAGLAIVQSGAASLTDVAHALRRQRHLIGEQQGAEASIRVRADQIDELMALVRELATAHAILSADSVVVDGAHEELTRKVTDAGRIVHALEALSRATRVVPLRPTFERLARVARDVAEKVGKQVELVVDGEDTEIDRAMVGTVADALLHLVRNAVDHGIEMPDARAAVGKSRTGLVHLRAYRTNTELVLELSDDGRGLDRDRLVQKALEQGIIASRHAVSDRDALDLIFAAGFSTAERVTDISGRGVGMDVVRRSVESLHGRVDVDTKLGHGSMFSMRLPLDTPDPRCR